MLIVQNNLLNSPGALLHSTFHNGLKPDPPVRFYGKWDCFGFCLCFLGNKVASTA